MSGDADGLRTDLLLDALVMPINMSRINSDALDRLPSASVAQRQQIVVDTVISLVEDGLAVTGYPSNDGGEFVEESLADTLQEIQSTYIARYNEPSEWMWSCWLKLTDDGFSVATSTPEGQRIAAHERRRLESIREREETSSGTDAS